MASQVTFFPFPLGLGPGFGGLGSDFGGGVGRGGSDDLEGFAAPGDLLLDLVDLLEGGSSPGSPCPPDDFPLFGMI